MHLSNDVIKRKIFNKLVFSKVNGRIIAGPFKSLQYLNKAHGSALIPRLLGSYEREIHPVIEEIIDKEYAYVIDVGAAEGFYAVGIARLFLNRSHRKFVVKAYDINIEALETLHLLVKLNGTDTFIECKSQCDHEELNKFNGDSTFLICDIEGNETQLLDPSKAPSLRKMDILVELHDGKKEDITLLIKNRFQATHKISLYHFKKRTPEDGPRWLLLDKFKLASVREGRKNGLKWMYLKSIVKD